MSMKRGWITGRGGEPVNTELWAKFSGRLGSHQMKAGFQYAYMWDRQTVGVTGNQRFTDGGFLPDPTVNAGNPMLSHGLGCDPTNPATFGLCNSVTTYYNTDGQAAPLYTALGSPDGLVASHFDMREVEALIERHRTGFEDATDRIWRLLNLELWHRVCIEGESHDEIGEPAMKMASM